MQVVVERNNDLNKDQKRADKNIKIGIGDGILNREIVVLDQRIEDKKRAIEIVRRERTKSECTRNQKSIKKNIKETDLDLGKKNIKESIEAEIRL